MYISKKGVISVTKKRVISIDDDNQNNYYAIGNFIIKNTFIDGGVLGVNGGYASNIRGVNSTIKNCTNGLQLGKKAFFHLLAIKY